MDAPISHHSSVPLEKGRTAPGFTLKSTPDQSVSLNEFRGQPVVLAFYPADWSPVRGDQMDLYNEILPDFHALGATVLGISVDGTWCHVAFARDRKLHFPLLSDFEPKGEVSRRYGVYRPTDGTCGRFWEMHDLLYENQGALDGGALVEYAGSLGLDDARLAREIRDGHHAGRVREDFRNGVWAGVNGTPIFFVNGERYDGATGLEPCWPRFHLHLPNFRSAQHKKKKPQYE